MLNEKLEVTDHDLRLMAISNNKDRPQLGANTAFAEGFKLALTKVKELGKTDVMLSVCECEKCDEITHAVKCVECGKIYDVSY